VIDVQASKRRCHEAHADVIAYFSRLHDPKLRRSTIGYMCPMDFEMRAGLAQPGINSTGSNLMSMSEIISPFFGRCAIVGFYIYWLTDIFNNWHSVLNLMSVKNVPLSPLFLLLALLLILMGCISLLFGYHARQGAVMLFGVTMAAATTMHDFWHINQPGLRAIEFAIFWRDIAICGGLLVIVGMGPGPFAITHRKKGGNAP
jgi:putative oxidoreductase